MTRTTLNQIKVELERLADAHKFVGTFFFGEPQRAVKELKVVYPLMCAYVESMQMRDNQTEIGIRLIVCDQVDKDWSVNVDEVLSDTASTCRDIFRVLNKSRFWTGIGRVEGNPMFSPFLPDEGNQDYVAGNHGLINFTLRDEGRLCDLPIDDNYDLK